MNGMWLAATDAGPSGGTVRTIRVLLADDHQIMREGLVSLLELEPDIEVIAEAGDGLEAVELTHQHQPDVVVLDVTMPRMNGIEAAKHIASAFPEIRIIGLSIHRRADMAKAMERAGAEAYLTKDGPSEDLLVTIRDGATPTP